MSDLSHLDNASCQFHGLENSKFTRAREVKKGEMDREYVEMLFRINLYSVYASIPCISRTAKPQATWINQYLDDMLTLASQRIAYISFSLPVKHAGLPPKRNGHYMIPTKNTSIILVRPIAHQPALSLPQGQESKLKHDPIPPQQP